MNTTTTAKLALALILAVPAFSLSAAEMTLKCDKKTLAGTLDKLDKSESNTINMTGDCNEDVVISGHKDLTLAGSGGASITATVFDPDPATGYSASTTALTIENSNVTILDLTINGGREAVACHTRSICTLRDVTIPSGWGGVTAQDQSSLYVFGSSSITDLLGTGIGVYGASRVNIRPNAWGADWDPAAAGPVLSNNDVGAWVQDGSFFRTDNVTITNNVVGVWAQRDAVLKIYSQPAAALPGVSNNWRGIMLRSSATAHIGVPINDNSGEGIWVGPLSAANNAGASFSNNGADMTCNHATAVDVNFGICP